MRKKINQTQADSAHQENALLRVVKKREWSFSTIRIDGYEVGSEERSF